MKFEDLTPEQIEQAKKCETPEERMAFIEENGIELSDEQLEDIAGGDAGSGSGGGCTGLGRRDHDWVDTGETRPNKLWGDNPPDRMYRCRKCGATVWKWVNIA